MSASSRTWVCPECAEPITAVATSQGRADLELTAVVLHHLGAAHPTSADLTNAHTQASGWLAPAGHLVVLWGGPQDGQEAWLPPGELPAAIGVARCGDQCQAAHLVRSATARMMPGVITYRLLGEGTTAVVYRYDGRTG